MALKTEKTRSENTSRIELVNSLFNCLDQEIEIYESILKTVIRKQQLFINNQELEFEELLEELDNLTEKAKKSDSKRLEIFKKLGLENKSISWIENHINKIRDTDTGIPGAPPLSSNQGTKIDFLLKEIPATVNNKNIEAAGSQECAKTIDSDPGFKNIPVNSFETIVKKTKKIKDLILAVSEINNSNVFLIDQGRKNVKAYFDMLFKESASSTYNNTGVIKDIKYKNVLIDEML